MKIEELMIISEGKPIFCALLNQADKERRSKWENRMYLYIKDGKLRFESSVYGGTYAFEASDESHKIARDLFVIQLQAHVKTKIFELKQLESILCDMGIVEYLGSSITDTSRILLDVIKPMTKEISNEIKNDIKSEIEDGIKETAKEIVETEIEEKIKPMAKEIANNAVEEKVRPIARKNIVKNKED